MHSNRLHESVLTGACRYTHSVPTYGRGGERRNSLLLAVNEVAVAVVAVAMMTSHSSRRDKQSSRRDDAGKLARLFKNSFCC